MVLTRREGGLKPDLSKLFDLFPSFYRATCEHPMKFSAAMVISQVMLSGGPHLMPETTPAPRESQAVSHPFYVCESKLGEARLIFLEAWVLCFMFAFFFFFLTLHLENIFMCLLPNLKLGAGIVSDLLKSRASSGTRIHQTTPSNTFPKPPEMTPRPQGRNGSREWHRSS